MSSVPDPPAQNGSGAQWKLGHLDLVAVVARSEIHRVYIVAQTALLYEP